jgi:flavin-dependent dehydrogenase
MIEAFDVAVVGGGPAGAAAATFLSRAGRSVVLCDAARFPRHKICGEYVPPSALPIFSRLGVLAAVDALAPRRHVGMAVVSPAGTKVLGRYGFPESGALALRRYDLDGVLLDQARRSGAVVLEATRVEGLARRPDGLFGLTVAGAARRGLRARAVIGADGRNSLVARRLGLRRAEAGHRRWAVMGHCRGVDAPDDHGEMIVTSYGYCGINPLPGGLTNVCIVFDPHGAGGPVPGRPGLRGFFLERLAAHPLTRRRTQGAWLVDGPWATGPMACRAARATADSVLLAGDAAGFYDPFTGEGISMALRGAEMAAAVLDGALRRGDLSRRSLAPYEAQRRIAFAARLRLDRLLQALLARPRLTDWVAGRLRRNQPLADLLARVAGDVADAREVLRPAFFARLLFA